MNDEKIRNACSGVHPSGERYPDGWPVRPLDELATALFEAQGPESKFADLEEHNRDDYRFEAVAAEEFFSKKISALEAERDALQELVDAYDGYAVSMRRTSSDAKLLLAARESKGQWIASDDCEPQRICQTRVTAYDTPHRSIVAGHDAAGRGQTILPGDAHLMVAAPDLAESLIAAESERDALRDAVRTMRDAEHDLGALRMKETESPGSVNTFDHTAAMDRRDHLTCELYELAGLREATGMTRLAYAEKMIREFILSLDSVPYGNVQNNLDKLKESIDNLREVVK